MNKLKINFLINRELFPEYVNINDFKRNVRLISHEVMKSESQMVDVINLNFCTDLEIKEINYKFLRHDYETDILTFRYDEKGISESDIMISVETVMRNSIKFKNSFINEACRVIIHGLLHLCGFEDTTRAQKQIMLAKENFYLNKLQNKGVI